MKSPKLLRRLTTHACVVTLLLSFAPAAFAQRRRRAPAPPRPPAQSPARTGSTPAPAPTPTRRAEPELSIEEMLAADSYTVYIELRRLGALARTEELKTAVAMFRLIGPGELSELQEVIDLYMFVSDNAETLGESRVVVSFLPARTGVPQVLMAIELESPGAAAAFEPKLRRLLGAKAQQVRKAVAGAVPEPVVVPKPEANERARGAARPAADFALRRAGRWLLAAESSFTLKRLRGDEDRPRLADVPRFQTIRSRFASDSLFVYVDTNVAQQGWALQMQKYEAERAALVEPTPDETAGTVMDVPIENGINVVAPTPEPEAQPEAQPTEPDPGALMSPEERAAMPEALVETDNLEDPSPPPPPTEEEIAVRGMERVLRGVWGGVPRIPGAVALGASLSGGALAVRLAVENTPDGTISLIPFLPNIVSGPPVTGETAAVAPADSELFIAGSLDWTQLWNSTVGAASVNPATLTASFGGDPDAAGEEPSEKPQPSVDESIAAVEKLFGFKFKEDLLPALGSEVAISFPLNGTGDFGLGRPRRGVEEKKEERDAEPGFVSIAALNNPERVREILPRVLVALGFSAFNAPQRAEKRKGFDIHTLGAGEGFSYAIINNFLVAGELKAVRHCVDSFDARRTLAATNAYRDTVAWQARQKLAHIYLSDSVLKTALEETKKRSGASTDPIVRALLAQLEAAETAPASYEATNEGDIIMHETRLPVSLIRAFALSLAVSGRDSTVLTNEAMATYALQRIVAAEMIYKNERKKGRFGTLEELIEEELLEEKFLENMEYKIVLEVVGDGFAVLATPKSYGKTGRRSFYADQTEIVRAADHKGQPATGDDPVAEP